jgi:hypothetical protein
MGKSLILRTVATNRAGLRPSNGLDLRPDARAAKKPSSSTVDSINICEAWARRRSLAARSSSIRCTRISSDCFLKARKAKMAETIAPTASTRVATAVMSEEAIKDINTFCHGCQSEELPSRRAPRECGSAPAPSLASSMASHLPDSRSAALAAALSLFPGACRGPRLGSKSHHILARPGENSPPVFARSNEKTACPRQIN